MSAFSFSVRKAVPGEPLYGEETALLLICFSGTATVTADAEQTVTSGGFCLFPSRTVCRTDGAGDVWAFLISEEAVALESVALCTELCSGVRSGCLDADGIDCFRRLKDVSLLPDPDRGTMIRVILTEGLMYLVRSISGGEDAAEPLIPRVMRYLDAHISAPLSLDDLASYFFVSKYHLCRSFKAWTGDSVHGYRIRRRVELASRLMERGETASCAAYRVGFGDYSSFYRAYKKQTGHAPTDREIPKKGDVSDE